MLYSSGKRSVTPRDEVFLLKFPKPQIVLGFGVQEAKHIINIKANNKGNLFIASS